jgi:hypothetical protein
MAKSLFRFRLDAFRRQAGRCYYCTAPMWLEDAPAFARTYGLTDRAARLLQCTAEHLHAKRDGGADSMHNVVAACRFCNGKRHWGRKVAPSATTYLRLVRSRLAQGRWHCPQIMARGLARIRIAPCGETNSGMGRIRDRGMYDERRLFVDRYITSNFGKLWLQVSHLLCRHAQTRSGHRSNPKPC